MIASWLLQRTVCSENTVLHLQHRVRRETRALSTSADSSRLASARHCTSPQSVDCVAQTQGPIKLATTTPLVSVQELSTAALDPLLAPLGLPASHLASITQLGFWRLAGPALSMAFGAAAQHLAASGTEREHGGYCAAMAASHAAAGAPLTRPASTTATTHTTLVPSAASASAWALARGVSGAAVLVAANTALALWAGAVAASTAGRTVPTGASKSQ